MALDLNHDLIQHPEAPGLEGGCNQLDACQYQYKPIKITEENDFLVWGVVGYVVQSAR